MISGNPRKIVKVDQTNTNQQQNQNQQTNQQNQNLSNPQLNPVQKTIKEESHCL